MTRKPRPGRTHRASTGRPVRRGLRQRGRCTSISRAVWATLGLVLTGALVGCQGVPQSGPVEVGLSNQEETNPQVVFSPTGPTPGSSQENIVRGFLQASSSNVDNYSVAREFLTPKYAPTWDPSPSVQIDDGSRVVIDRSETSLTMEITPIATLDGSGALRQNLPDADVELRYTLEQVDGEWRISSAGSGLVLDRSTFQALYSQHDLFYKTSNMDVLIPDPRWFQNRATTTTNVVNELLAGPSEPLRSGGVVTGFPAGTQLVAESVPIYNGLATIDLSRDVLGAAAESRELLQRQLAASLQSVGGVSEYEVTIEQAPYLQGKVENESSTQYPKVLNSSVVIRDGELGDVNGDSLNSLGSVGSTVAALQPQDATVSHDGRDIAALIDGVVGYFSPQGRYDLDARPDLISPSLDRFGYVWTVPAGKPNEVQATLPGTEQLDMVGTWNDAEAIHSFRVSQDGSRAAALVDLGTASCAIEVGIVRDMSGAPTGFTPPETLLWLTGEPVDLDWIDAARVAVLVQQSDGGSQITIGGLGLFPQEAGTTTGNMVSIAGANARSQLRVLGEGGQLLAPQGSGWQRVAEDVEVLVKQG